MNMDELRAMKIGDRRKIVGIEEDRYSETGLSNVESWMTRVPGGWLANRKSNDVFVPDPLIALAGQAMQGLLAKNGATHIPSMAMEATEYAKSLLAELERSE